MMLDGAVMLTSRDNFIYHEMMVHPPLFNHQNPKDIVIVGGGDCGTLNEVLKHDTVVKVTQIELDERVTRVSEQFFPELCVSNNDERVTLLFEDAVAWMKNAEPESLDVIILDTTDPYCVAEVTVNPESRVKVRAAPGPKELMQSGWRTFLVKVHNEVTTPGGQKDYEIKRVRYK